MYAKITKDLIWEPGDQSDSRVNEVVICKFHTPVPDDLLDVRLLDDDRILYYEALADDESLEHLFYWAQRDAGVTILQVKKGGKWEDVIS
jgi:hypothetical protein